MAFLIGWMHFLAGGFWEGIIWMSNPLYFLGVFLLFKQSKKAFHVFLTAFILAVIFVFFKDITMTKSGRMAKIISLQSGYYLWLLSIFVAACYSFYQNFSLSKLFKR